MSIDAYALCPCGNGKKIKFCKCKDSLADMDSILKMVEGGQIVPALDRLSSVLDEHPDAAWALAIRGGLLLDLREYDSLSENADRFIRLQPSNPLALTQRAAALLFRGDIEASTESMLEALTESGREVDSFVLDVASVLAFSLAQQGIFLTSRVYASLALMTSGYGGGQTAETVLRQLNSSPSVNQLLKSVPSTIPRPPDANWAERYDEASNLLRSNKINLAESKFQSLQRTHPNEPAVLSGLLTCAIWRGDVQGQVDFFKKLSACESLEFEERTRYRAVAAMVNPHAQEIAVEVLQLKANIEKADEVEMAFTSSSRFVALPPEMLADLQVSEDDVPPKAAFQILDRDKPDSLEQLPPVQQVPEAIAIVFLYGKQTDRDARIELHDVRRNDVAEVRRVTEAAIGSVEFDESAGEPLAFLTACQPAVAMIRFQAKPAEAAKLQNDLMESRMPDVIASLKLPILGGESLESSAGDQSKLLERTALMRIVEQFDTIASKGDSILGKVYAKAKIEPLPPLKPTAEEVETIVNADLNRIDPSDLDPESLIYLLQRAQQISATPAIRKLASRLLNVELSEEQKPAKLLAYMSLINSAAEPEAALKMLEEAKRYADANNIPIANLLLSEVSLRLAAGDGAGFQKTIETISTRYGSEPEVMARLQQMLVAYGLIRPDGTAAQAPSARPSAAPTAGVWTPDSGAPAAPAARGSGGGGKLWLPGMD